MKFAILVALLTILGCGEGRAPEIRLFYSRGCQGDNATFDPASPFSGIFVKSASADGLWYFTGYDHENAANIRGWKFGRRHDSCMNLESNYTFLDSIRQIGARDLDTPALALFASESFAGAETYVEGQESSFGRQWVGSWAFSGTRNWTVYADAGYTGEATCLVADSWEEGTVTYRPYGGMWGGSVHQGCDVQGSRILRGSSALEEKLLMQENSWHN